jgi:hypothetical protein
MVESILEVQPEFQAARKAVVDAQYAVDVIKGAVVALDHRKKALEKESELWLGQYWARPREPAGEVGRQMNDARSQAAYERSREALAKKKAEG